MEERQKLMRKRVKKLKNKILCKGSEYESQRRTQTNNETKTTITTPLTTTAPLPQPVLVPKSKVPRLIKELEKISNSNDRYNPSLDRNCGELNRILLKNTAEQFTFSHNNGLSICIRLLEQINNINLNGPQSISAVSTEIISNSTKTTNNLVCLLISSIRGNLDSCAELLLSNKLLSLVEILNLHSNIMLYEINLIDPANGKSTNSNHQKISNEWLICSSLFQLISLVFFSICGENQKRVVSEEMASALAQRAFDFIRFVQTLFILFTNQNIINIIRTS